MSADALDLSSPDLLSEDLQDMRNKFIDQSNQVAAEQPVLEIESSEPTKGVDTDKFFKDAASKVMGREADEFVKGYATLDDLIGRTGGIKAGTSTYGRSCLRTFSLNTTRRSSRKQAELAMMKLAYLIETNPGRHLSSSRGIPTASAEWTSINLSVNGVPRPSAIGW